MSVSPPSLSLSPDEAVAALTEPGAPCLIGVRHHAPSLAAAVPALLDAAAPDVLLVELPAEMQDWLPWLGHEETRAPVALAAACPREGGGPAFYPFADFSPELAAVRWAARHGVPVVACDLPLADRVWRGGRRPGAPASPVAPSAPVAPEVHRSGLTTALRARLTGRPGEDLWDRLVEATAPGSEPEALRRAALLTGWALREEAVSSGGVPELDLRREGWMRSRLADATVDGARAAVVVGAFHAPALLSPAVGAEEAGATDGAAAVGAGRSRPGDAEESGWTTSLIPYTYALLDKRSGYPAGIRDPEWQHLVLRAAGDPDALEEALTRAAVRVCVELRDLGHPSGPADAREITRLASDLARLRGLPAAGRGELVEAIQTVLAQGEPYGRGRAVARAMERVLVGNRGGRPAPGAPRSGLAPAVETELSRLGLPGPRLSGTNGGASGGATGWTSGPGAAARELRLDPLRSDVDRDRDLLLRRLTVCGVPYGELRGVVGAGGAEALTTRWEVRWTPATEAMLSAVGVHGVTPAQAAEGVLRERRRTERDEGGPMAAQTLDGLRQAAECGLPELTDARLAEAADVLPGAATLSELLTGLGLLDRLRAGHVAGLGVDKDRAVRADAVADVLTAAAVRQVDGLAGAEDPADAHALLELAHRADVLGGVRLTEALARLAREGSPLMRGAAGAVRVLLGHEAPDVLGGRVASWVDTATDRESRSALTARLTGLLTAGGPLLESAAPALEPLLDRVSGLSDRDFLHRLPALRGGFDTLSPAARDRLLAAVEERLDIGRPADRAGSAHLTDLGRMDPVALAVWTRADLTARATLDGLGLLPSPTPPAAPTPPSPAPSDPVPAPAPAPAPASTPARASTPPSTPTPTSPSTSPSTPTSTPTSPSTDKTDSPDHTPTTASAPPPDPALHHLAPVDRWRLVLGRRTDQLPPSASAPATALDELYGNGRGEGSRGELNGPGRDGGGGGREASYPSVREWSEELRALFGPGVREEVLAAAAAGRPDVLAELDPDSVRPSVDLLRTVLRHAGGLPEARLAALRPLVRRLVEALTRQLATRLRPALHGAVLPRPSRRPGGGLDLPRTLRANLASARRGPDGKVLVVPERPVFRTRAGRAADWRLILVTDVSGSMEASTVWAALTASVLAGVPTLSTHFLAFSTEVMDLTDHVDDPLSLLLEVSVGGGTHIAAGLRHARELVTVPSRTLVVVISDFEEGYPVGGLLAEVRALAGSGCHVLGCASLDDTGRPRYSTAVAGQLVAAGMLVAALSPLELAGWVGEKIA
ncbi:DUF5682 family protein [Streptomyces sp. NPDC058534]|uniref:vWA domain-containing protein n=1 Tax=Streptomyces sp. NPDC058534 TaxID=3346541 RepID=UPI003652AE3B